MTRIGSVGIPALDGSSHRCCVSDEARHADSASPCILLHRAEGRTGAMKLVQHDAGRGCRDVVMRRRLTDTRRDVAVCANRTGGTSQATHHVPMRKVQREPMSIPAARHPAPRHELTAVLTPVCPIGRKACGELLPRDVNPKVARAIGAPVFQDAHAVHLLRCSPAAVDKRLSVFFGGSDRIAFRGTVERRS